MNASKAASLLQSLRKRRRGGRPKVMRECRYCGQQFGTRELREHLPVCGKKGKR